MEDKNLALYNSKEVVDYYNGLTAISPIEKHLFQKYLQPNSQVLELGVGGARVTPAIVAITTHYIGLDHSDLMVSTCQKKLPQLRFEVGDAADLSRFKNQSFDVIVFAFNGIDELHPDEKRSQCLRECHRLLKPGGIFIFSSHNAKKIVELPDYSNASPVQVIWRTFLSSYCTIIRIFKTGRSQYFWKGFGYRYRTNVHGGIVYYMSSPEFFAKELKAHQFSLVETHSSLYPRAIFKWNHPWYYYVARK